MKTNGRALPMLDTYSGATRVIFIVGDPIAQVKSPAFLTRALRDADADCVVVPAHVAPADLQSWLAAVQAMRNVDGVVVTVPHKLAAAALCTSLSGRAQSIGAANVLRRNKNDGWHGDIVDGVGYAAGLRKLGCEPKGRRVLLVGAGGAGSAIAHALVDAGVARLAVHETDDARRLALLEKLRTYGFAAPEAGSDDPAGFDLVINATPMGMEVGDPLPVQAEKLSANTFVGDVITVPPVSPLLEAAQARGCATMTGLNMFESVCERMVDFYLQK